MKDYDRDKWYRILKCTQLNYSNLLNRLSKDHKRSNFIIIYYSTALIIYSLSTHFFETVFNEDFTSYASIILSIIVLIYSIINSNARYSERITSVLYGLNEIKTLKRRLAAGEDLAIVDEEYGEIIAQVEYRDDLDFYRTIHYMCNKYGINVNNGTEIENPKYIINESDEELKIIKSEIRGYISEINPKVQQFQIWVHFLWHILLYSFPVLIFLLCIFVKKGLWLYELIIQFIF